jgi:hypothetical protein
MLDTRTQQVHRLANGAQKGEKTQKQKRGLLTNIIPKIASNPFKRRVLRPRITRSLVVMLCGSRL